MIEVVRVPRRTRSWSAVRVTYWLGWNPWSLRTCTSCGRTKPKEAFDVKRGRCPCGLPMAWASWCIECARESARYTKGMAKRGKPFEPRKPAMTRKEINALKRDRYRQNPEKYRKKARDQHARRKAKES